MPLMKRLSAYFLLLLLTGCGVKPSINILSYIGQPPSVIEAKYGKPPANTSTPESYVYSKSDGIEMLNFWFIDGKCTEILVQFDGEEISSANALERVGLTENAIAREAEERTDRGWTYRNQQFGTVIFSQIKTLKQDGKYHGVRAEL